MGAVSRDDGDDDDRNTENQFSCANSERSVFTSKVIYAMIYFPSVCVCVSVCRAAQHFCYCFLFAGFVAFFIALFIWCLFLKQTLHYTCNYTET